MKRSLECGALLFLDMDVFDLSHISKLLYNGVSFIMDWVVEDENKKGSN